MKIVLKQDIEKLGVKGEIKKVKNGYARNFLIPQKLAIPATEKEIKQAKRIQTETKKRKSEAQKEIKEYAKKLDKQKLKISAKTNKEKILFGSITAKDIAKEIKNQYKIEIDEKIVSLPKTIKKTGDYKIKLKFAPEIIANIKLTISKK